MADQSFWFRRQVGELTVRQIHTLALVLASRRRAKAGQPIGLAELPDRFLADSPATLIVKAYGRCPPGMLGCLGKLPGRSVLSWKAYVDLLELFEEPHAANVLLHARRISTRIITDLKALDPNLRRPEFLGVVRKFGSVEAVNFLARSVLRFCPDADRRVVLGSLAAVTNPEGIERWYGRWIAKAPLPAPPWPGSETIRPLASVAEMRSAAKAFRNCLVSRVNYVLYGDRYYYQYAQHNSPPDAIIELINDRRVGWSIGEIRGPKNRLPPRRLLRAMVDELDRVGIRQRPNPDRLPDFLDPRFWI